MNAIDKANWLLSEGEGWEMSNDEVNKRAKFDNTPQIWWFSDGKYTYVGDGDFEVFLTSDFVNSPDSTNPENDKRNGPSYPWFVSEDETRFKQDKNGEPIASIGVIMSGD